MEIVYTSDRVDVVYCQNCANGKPTKNARGERVVKCHAICGLCGLPRLMPPNWYCADGERMQDNEAD